MKKGASYYFDVIIPRFKQSFDNAAEKIFAKKMFSKKNKLIVLQYIHMMYDKWMFSALIEETVLSPANLLSAQMEYMREEKAIFPQIYLKENEGSLTDDFLDYKLIPYSLDSHPLIDDLKIFLGHCANGYDINQNDNCYDYDFLKEFSVPTTQYIDYLIEISLKLKLIKKLPSINSTVVQSTNDNKAFFKKSSKDILTAIVKFTIDDCVSYINQILPVPPNFKQTLFEMLVNEDPVEEIFRLLLENIHLDFGQFIEAHSNDEFGEIFSGMMDLSVATFGIGIAIDKYFLTPLGSYLKLIQPVYVLPCNLADDLDILLSCIDEGINVETAIYAPSSGYFLTPLGLELFEQSNDQDNKYRLPSGVSLDSVFNSIRLSGTGAKKIPAKILTDLNKQLNKKIVRFFLTSAQLPDSPQAIEIDETESLEALHDSVCVSFNLDSFCEYAFFMGNDDSPFSVYSSNNELIKGRKTWDTKIQSLQLSVDDKFKLIIYGTSLPVTLYEMPGVVDIEIEMEVLKFTPGKFGYLYPREM